MDWQVEARWQLGCTYDSVWPGLTRSSVHWLATTCAHFSRDQICMQGTHVGWLPFVHSCWSRRKAHSLIMGFCMSCVYFWSLNESQFPTQVQLATTWESVWPGLNDSNLLVFTDSVVRAETSVSFLKELEYKVWLVIRAVCSFHFVSKAV